MITTENRLTPEQMQAAQFKNGICAVIAVPGSGKTRTMMERIKVLVQDYNIPPENILGLTFTRNAADEMKQRLVYVLGDKSERVHLSTIHSFCYYLLKREGVVFEILSGKNQLIFLKQVMTALEIENLPVGSVLREISLAKNNVIPPDEFKILFEGDKTMALIGDIYAAYDTRKAKKMLFDFDDLLIQAYLLLKDDSDVRKKYQESFNNILVDEYQDTNPCQLELLRQLITANNNGSSFWIAGDDHQSIYGFAGASVGNILNFKDMFPGSDQFILDMNFRSSKKIVQACANLASHCQRQIHKDFKTNNSDGEDVIVLESSNEVTEALGLVGEITDLIERRGYEYQDIAVLYRANFQSLYVEEAFLQHKIPFYIQGGQSFYSRSEVKHLLDYLRVIDCPDSNEADEALLNIINIPNRYIGKRVKSELQDFAKANEVHLYQALKDMQFQPDYVRKNINTFADMMDGFIQDKDEYVPSEIIQFIRSHTDYDRWLADEDLPSPDNIKINNVDQLQIAAGRYDSISEFLEYTDTFQDTTVSDDPKGVNLMTIHKAKGLEFKIVFVIGMVEGLLPSKKGNIEEERRICFVAVSRAKELLYLSHPLSYLGVPSKKSVFISEILGLKEPENNPS